MMQTKTVPSIRVISAQKKLSISAIGAFGAEIAPLMEAEVQRCGLAVAGNWIYRSFNLPKNGKDLFDFEICLPVSGIALEIPTFEEKELPEFHCIYREYQGKLRFLFSQGYRPLLEELRSGKIPVTGESREVYLFWEEAKSVANRIEIQFGLHQ